MAFSLPGLSTQSGPGAQLTTPTSSYGFVQTDGTISMGTYVGSGAGWFGTSSNHPLQFFTNNSGGQVTLLPNGNFGIGTTTPGEQLEVDGANAVTRIRNTNDPIGAFLGNGYGSLQMGMYNPTNAAVGSVPAHTKQSFLGVDSSGVACTLTNTFPNGMACRNTLDDGKGNVGIGTSVPSSQLEVDGASSTIRLFDTNNAGYGGTYIQQYYNKLYLGMYNPTNTDWGAVHANEADPFMSIDNHGAICSIVFSNCRNMLDDGLGNGYFWGDVTVHQLYSGGTTQVCADGTGKLITCSSSLRYKTNVADLSLGLDVIAQLRPVTYDWKSDGQHDLGLIAEEVNAVAPILTTYKDGQVEGVKYDKLTAVLVKGIQEQQQQITSLKSQVSSLQSQNATLEKKNDDLEARVNAIEQTLKDNGVAVHSNAETIPNTWVLFGGLVAVGFIAARRHI
jgi:hypothetical protein